MMNKEDTKKIVNHVEKMKDFWNENVKTFNNLPLQKFLYVDSSNVYLDIETDDLIVIFYDKTGNNKVSTTFVGLTEDLNVQDVIDKITNDLNERITNLKAANDNA